MSNYTFRGRLNGLGSPFGIETDFLASPPGSSMRLNGLGSPFGIETSSPTTVALVGGKEEGSLAGSQKRKWLGEVGLQSGGGLLQSRYRQSLGRTKTHVG